MGSTSRFLDSVRVCVIAEVAQSGQTSSSKAVDNLFTTTITELLDDDGKALTKDVGEDFFRELILMYTVPADTIMSVHPSSRKPAKHKSNNNIIMIVHYWYQV